MVLNGVRGRHGEVRGRKRVGSSLAFGSSSNASVNSGKMSLASPGSSAGKPLLLSFAIYIRAPRVARWRGGSAFPSERAR